MTTTTPSHAGSATGIDLDKLQRLADSGIPTALDTATFRALIALARATPQHPEAPADGSLSVPRELLARCLSSMKHAVTFGETRQGRPPSQTCLFEIEDLEAILAGRATPQHSVTEQVLRKALRELLLAYEANVEGADAARDAQSLLDRLEDADDARAQPLASTAATQPEQAGIKTWQDRSGMREFIQPKDAIPHMLAEIADLRAALAIPASTAASEQMPVAKINPAYDRGIDWLVSIAGIPEGTLLYASPVSAAAASEQQASVSEGQARLAETIRFTILSAKEAKDWKTADLAREALHQLAALSGRATIPNALNEGHLRTLLSIIYAAGVAKMDVTEDYERVLSYVGRATIPSDADEREYVRGVSDGRAYQRKVDQKILDHRATTATASYKLVPIEPTPEMREAAASFGGPGNGYSSQRGDEAVESYRHMLAAAPDTATTAADQQGDTDEGDFSSRSRAELIEHIERLRAELGQQGAAQAQAGDTELIRTVVTKAREFYLGYLSSRLTGADFDAVRSMDATDTACRAIAYDLAAMAAPATGSKA